MNIKITWPVLILGILLTSCEVKVEGPPASEIGIVLNVRNLKNLGEKAQYEGWIIVDGTPVSTGRFTVNDKGKQSKYVFQVNKIQLERATKFILTIEPNPDNDEKPSKVHILAGVFKDKSANLTMDDSSALKTNFSKAKGGYVLTTPSNGSSPPSQEESGVWFLDPSEALSGKLKASLTLPTLPEGWKYEGWVVVEGKSLSTGKFTSVTGADEDNNPYAKDKSKTPKFPGEDFLENAPTGFKFPLDIRGGKVIISVEPNPDNDDAKPFFINPLLSADVKKDAGLQTTLHEMKLNTTVQFIEGTAEKLF